MGYAMIISHDICMWSCELSSSFELIISKDIIPTHVRLEDQNLDQHVLLIDAFSTQSFKHAKNTIYSHIHLCMVTSDLWYTDKY